MYPCHSINLLSIIVRSPHLPINPQPHCISPPHHPSATASFALPLSFPPPYSLGATFLSTATPFHHHFQLLPSIANGSGLQPNPLFPIHPFLLTPPLATSRPSLSLLIAEPPKTAAPLLLYYPATGTPCQQHC